MTDGYLLVWFLIFAVAILGYLIWKFRWSAEANTSNASLSAKLDTVVSLIRNGYYRLLTADQTQVLVDAMVADAKAVHGMRSAIRTALILVATLEPGGNDNWANEDERQRAVIALRYMLHHGIYISDDAFDPMYSSALLAVMRSGDLELVECLRSYGVGNLTTTLSAALWQEVAGAFRPGGSSAARGIALELLSDAPLDCIRLSLPTLRRLPQSPEPDGPDQAIAIIQQRLMEVAYP